MQRLGPPAPGPFTTLSVSTSFLMGTNVASGFGGTINAAANTSRIFTFQTGGVRRWEMGVGGGAESGSAAGSDFYLNSYADDGVTLTGYVMYGHRFNGGLTIGLVEIKGGTIDTTPVGSIHPSTGAFTSLYASGPVSGPGFDAYLAAPPAMGGTTPAVGAFTTLTANTPAFGDSSANAATTAFVQNATNGVQPLSTTGGTTTLTAVQASAPVLLVTGALTSAAIIVVPAAGLFVVANRTTGSFTLTVKTASGTGVAVSQGYTDYLFADGTNVVMGDSDLAGGVLTGGTVIASPIGGTAPAAGAFTNLSASGTVSGTGLTNYLASPPAIGGTAQAAGSFTALTSTGAHQRGTSTALTAAGTTLATALALTKSVSLVATAAATTAGVALLNAAPATGNSVEHVLRSSAANTFNVYPPTSSAQIDALGAGVATTIAAGITKRFIQVSATQYYSA